ncbi:hypothetical protein Ahia01_001002200, partial [Argonauta hians]
SMMDQLVSHMRNAEYRTLLRAFNAVSKPSFCRDADMKTRKYFLDAIAMVGTSSSVKLMQELMSRNQVPYYNTNMWLLSLSFIQNPTRDMISASMVLAPCGWPIITAPVGGLSTLWLAYYNSPCWRS